MPDLESGIHDFQPRSPPSPSVILTKAGVPPRSAPSYCVPAPSIYIDHQHLTITTHPMPLQIANPIVVAKVERLARATGLTKTAVVERAIDRLAGDLQAQPDTGRLAALLAQLDRIPDRPDALNPLEWDEHGLPR